MSRWEQDVNVPLMGALLEGLQTEARLRGLTVSELVTRLLRHILDDKLFNAVLDGDDNKS
jgi:hypothetical protein